MKKRGLSVERIARAAKTILEEYGVEFAYMFGSAATGNATLKSDIDIAVFMPDTLSKEERFDLRLVLMGHLSRLLKRDVDVVALNDLLSLFFRYVIITEGRAFYEKRESRRMDFEMRTLGSYFDFQPFLEAYNRHYVQSNH